MSPYRENWSQHEFLRPIAWRSLNASLVSRLTGFGASFTANEQAEKRNSRDPRFAFIPRAFERVACHAPVYRFYDFFSAPNNNNKNDDENEKRKKKEKKKDETEKPRGSKRHRPYGYPHAETTWIFPSPDSPAVPRFSPYSQRGEKRIRSGCKRCRSSLVWPAVRQNSGRASGTLGNVREKV